MYVDPRGTKSSMPVQGYPSFWVNTDQCDCFPVIKELMDFADYGLQQYRRLYLPQMIATRNIFRLYLGQKGYHEVASRAVNRFPSHYVRIDEARANPVTDAFVVKVSIAQPGLDHCLPIAATAVRLHEDRHRQDNSAARSDRGLPSGGDLSGLLTAWFGYIENPGAQPWEVDAAELIKPEGMRKYAAEVAFSAAFTLRTEENAFAAAKRFLDRAQLALSELCYCRQYVIPPSGRGQ